MVTPLPPEPAPPPQSQPHWWVILPPRDKALLLIGFFLVLLSIASVSFTAVRNIKSAGRAQCGIQVIHDMDAALKARDAALIALNESSRVVSTTRQELFLALAGVPQQPPKTVAQAIADHTITFNQYTHDLDVFKATVLAAPIPSAQCLDRDADHHDAQLSK